MMEDETLNNTTNNNNDISSSTKDTTYLEKLFNEFDNGTGYLEQDQLKQTVSKITGRNDITDEELSTLLNTFDTDKDGKISLDEFLNGCTSHSIVDEEDFQTYITHSNNNSSYRPNLNGHGHHSHDAHDDDDTAVANIISNNIQENGYHDDHDDDDEDQNNSLDDINDQEKHLKFIFSLFDKDGDGLVSIEQLRNMLEDIKVKSAEGGESSNEDFDDNDDDDIEYIINTLSADGSKTISFENFMKAIEQINSPQNLNNSINGTNNNGNGNLTGSPMHEDTTVFDGPQSDTELEEADNNHVHEGDNSNNSRSNSPIITSPEKRTRTGRGRAGSWVAPISIVNMIKRRTDLYSKDQIQVFDSNDNLADKYKKEAALLRTEKEHLGSKLHLFEGQLKEARESQEKLSEDNAQLKESITIGKKTLIENQKLSNHNKKLQEHIEDLKQQLNDAEDQKSELLKTTNRIKTDKDQIAQELELKEKDLKEKEKLLNDLQNQQHNLLSHSAGSLSNHASNQSSNSSDSLTNPDGTPIDPEQLRQENNNLKTTLIAENEKAQETIKLLTEELKKLQKKSKGDRELLESHNQLIHNLKTNLEEAQSNSASNFDPNLKLSLLSELEHQVVARLGSTPSTTSNSLIDQFDKSNSFSPYRPSTMVIETTNSPSTTLPIGISTNNHHHHHHHQDDDDDLKINSSSSISDNEDSSNNNSLVSIKNIEIKSLKSTLENEIENKKQLLEKIEQSKIDNGRLEAMVESLKQLNQELTDKHQEQTTTLSNMVQELQDQKKQLNDQVILLQESNQVNSSELLKQIESLQQQLIDKQKSFDQSLLEIQENSSKEKNEFQSNITLLQSTLDQLKLQHSNEIQDIKNQLLNNNSSNDEEIQSLKIKIQSSEDENEKLLKRVDLLEFENQKMLSQQQVLAKSIETPSNLSDPINIKAGQTQNEISSLKQRLDELSLKNNHLLSENTQLKNSLTPVDSPSNSQRDINTSNLLNNEGSINVDDDKSNYNLIKSTSATSIENLQNEISSLNSLNQQLQKDLKNYELKTAAAVAANSSSVQLVNNTNLIDQLKKENEKSNEKFRALEYENLLEKESNKDLLNRNQALQDRIDSMKIEYENNLNQIQINEKKSKLLKEIDELKSKLKKYESDSDHHQIEMEDETKSLKDRIEDLSTRLQNEKNLTKHLQSQLNSINSENDDQVPLMGGNVRQKNRGCCTIL